MVPRISACVHIVYVRINTLCGISDHGDRHGVVFVVCPHCGRDRCFRNNVTSRPFNRTIFPVETLWRHDRCVLARLSTCMEVHGNRLCTRAVQWPIDFRACGGLAT